MSKIVELNVGGEYYATTEETIMKYPDSMLAKLISGNFNVTKDRKGRIFIDRSKKLFEHVSQYLRANTIPQKEDAMKELFYFGLVSHRWVKFMGYGLWHQNACNSDKNLSRMSTRHHHGIQRNANIWITSN